MLAEDICVKLRPILGEKVDRLWRAYLVEDTDGKREIEQILNMMYVDNINTDLDSKNIDILAPPPAENVRGDYPIGEITYAGKKMHPFCLREHDWIKHVLIVGASGSGKTNLCFQVLKNFIYKKKPFLVLDWKRNYRDIIKEKYGKDVRVYTVGRDVAPFRFNPLIPPPGTSAKTWLKKLIEIIAHATYVGEGVMYLLQKALDKTYRDFGLYNSKPITNYPTLKDLLNTIESTEAKGREAGWMSSTLRALGALTFGETGKTFNVRQQSDMVDLLNQQVILEMDSLTNSDKIFLVESILLWIHHYRLSSPSQKREEFDHAIILEEAHHVIGKDKSDLVGGESITDVIIREIRELGESVIIIDQCPSLLSLPARGNTWCTIVLNLKDAKDVNSAASSLLLEASDKKVLGRLDIGEAVAKIQGRWHKPFMIHVPHIPIKKGSVDDKMISEVMRPYSTYSTSESVTIVEEKEIPQNEAARKISNGITSEEQILLKDIYSNKLSGVVQRYKRLGWSRRKGNELKNSLVKKQLIDTEEIPTKSGRVIVLKLTREGKRICSEPITNLISDIREGGITHEYWKNKYAKILKDKGFDITFEKPIGEGKSVDVVATKNGRQIAIEVETGRSDILSNINKCLQANFDKIIVVAINEKIESKVKSLLEKNDLHQNPKIILSCARRTA
ncbi:MAG: ATP-binding protein [Ignavibacteriae bacterium]|nr:ATP-binding protein [Ignavibacteriota bacterium]NOG99298.1 ATP-binding protein [Ignavibacteriota bacterium]